MRGSFSAISIAFIGQSFAAFFLAISVALMRISSASCSSSSDMGRAMYHNRRMLARFRSRLTPC